MSALLVESCSVSCARIISGELACDAKLSRGESRPAVSEDFTSPLPRSARIYRESACKQLKLRFEHFFDRYRRVRDFPRLWRSRRAFWKFMTEKERSREKLILRVQKGSFRNYLRDRSRRCLDRYNRVDRDKTVRKSRHRIFL